MIRSTPPPLAWALLLYLPLVAWSLFGSAASAPSDPLPSSTEEGSRPGGEAFAPAPCPVDCREGPAPVPGTHPPTTVANGSTGPVPAPPRARRRPRLRVLPEPSLAARIQVGPGQFVRGAPPDPSPATVLEPSAKVSAPDPLAAELPGRGLSSPDPPDENNFVGRRGPEGRTRPLDRSMLDPGPDFPDNG